MLVLALDTTTRQGSVALLCDGRLLGMHVGDAAVTHGERLPGDLARVLDPHAATVGDIDLFAVAAGPGSFTGLRIGIATMQGLALANGRSLVGVSTLDAIYDAIRSPLAQGGVSHSGEVAVWMDAQRGQVFSAVYEGGNLVEAPMVDKPAEILGRWAERDFPKVFAGDGALVYRDVVLRAVPLATVVPDVPALAPSVGRLAEAHERRCGPSAPEVIGPIYVRRPDAELARERRSADPKVGTTQEKG
jgi:tRNA threonylcarbamoyladenosine biosynthesis protein TsaB